MMGLGPRFDDEECGHSLLARVGATNWIMRGWGLDSLTRVEATTFLINVSRGHDLLAWGWGIDLLTVAEATVYHRESEPRLVGRSWSYDLLTRIAAAPF